MVREGFRKKVLVKDKCPVLADCNLRAYNLKPETDVDRASHTETERPSELSQAPMPMKGSTYQAQ